MVWFLKSKQNGKKSKILLSNKKYKIGRLMPNAEVDIPIDSDQTVSRLHAELLVKFDQDQCSNLESLPSIVLTDNSKFGTFINSKKIDGFKALKQNDVIRFGAYNSIYQLCHDPLIVTTSCLSRANRDKVCHLVTELCGHLVQDWINECELVIMESITVTVKVIDALISQKRIVTVKYLEEIINSESLPEPKDFLPPIGEENLESEMINFEPNSKRQVLFKEKSFVFLADKQLQKFQNIIELASGKCELFDKSIHVNKNKVNENGLMFIRSDSTDPQMNNVQLKMENFLHLIGHRLIEECEIGLAVLYANLDQYCNPIKRNKIEKISKVASQTLTDTCFRNNYEFCESQQTEMQNKSQDSCLFQFENKAEDLFIVSDTPEPARKRPAENQEPRSLCESKKKSPPIKIKMNETKLAEKVVPKEKPAAKKEPEIKKENKSWHKTGLESSLVYSKLNPPASLQQSQLNKSGTIQPSAQIVIKYEPLVRNKTSATCQSYPSSNHEGKKNFKKFRKVPRASQLSASSNKDCKFKSFKHQEFDLESQFEMFMSSNK